MWNDDVLWAAMGRTLERVSGHTADVDSLYTWEEPELFYKEAAKNDYLKNLEQLRRTMAAENITEYEAEAGTEICRENIALIEPYVAAHPDTEFCFFLPPYSILYWERQVECHRAEYVINVYKTAAETLLAYPNVTFYTFQKETEYITDLNNYRDETHHTPEGNRMVFEAMYKGNESYGTQVTAENVENLAEEMLLFVNDYPYDTLWEEEQEATD